MWSSNIKRFLTIRLSDQSLGFSFIMLTLYVFIVLKVSFCTTHLLLQTKSKVDLSYDYSIRNNVCCFTIRIEWYFCYSYFLILIGIQSEMNFGWASNLKLESLVSISKQSTSLKIGLRMSRCRISLPPILVSLLYLRQYTKD